MNNFGFSDKMKIIRLTFIIFAALLLNGCSVSYNFTGTGKIDAKTYQVNFFQNTSELVQPGIERSFTNRLQDLIQNQTNLSLTSNGGDLIYEGEITDYRITPMAATADQRAAENRLTIRVNVRFTNTKHEDESFEKPFSFYQDYAGGTQPTGAELTTLIDAIFERITQDIFNESLAKW